MRKSALRLRSLFFLVMLVLELAIPAWLLSGTVGAVIGAAGAVTFFFWLRTRATQHLRAALHATPISEVEAPELCGMVRELARRGSLPCPRLYGNDDAAANVACFGLEGERRSLIITQGFRDQLRRDEQFAWLGLALYRAVAPETPVRTMAALFWQVAERILGADQMQQRWDKALRAALLFPFFWLPALALRFREEGDEPEKFAVLGARLSGFPLALSEGMRKMHWPAPGARAYPGSLRRLFLRPPRHANALLALWTDQVDPRAALRRLDLALGVRTESQT